MGGFNYMKFILAIAEGIAIAWAGVGILGLRLCDALMAAGAFTLIGSFTFIHTMFGQNAARVGSAGDLYEKVSRDMRYNIREESGYIKETLIVGILELVLGIILLFIK